jgi:hypothetical protein
MDALAVEPPPTGADLRRLMNLAQIVQSNALSFFHLSSPDLLFGFDAEPATRNIIGVAKANPQPARDGIGVRKFGQQIVEWLGGKVMAPSPTESRAGGIRHPALDQVDQDAVDEIGRRRAARQVDVNSDDSVDGPGHRQQGRHDVESAIVTAGWWAWLVAGSAVGSIVILTLVLSPSLLLGYAIDLALLWLVAASGWSPAKQAVL